MRCLKRDRRALPLSHSQLAYVPVVGKKRHSLLFGAIRTSTVERVKQHTPPRIGCATNPYPEVDPTLNNEAVRTSTDLSGATTRSAEWRL